jgi:hypothetical protein
MKQALIAVVIAVASTALDAQESIDPADLNPAVTLTRTPTETPESPAVSEATSRTAGPQSVAIDRLDLGTTSITGNQELPKVLYIVPWKRSDLGDLIGRPVDTLLDEALAPVDPEVFERHLSYYESLHGHSEEE